MILLKSVVRRTPCTLARQAPNRILRVLGGAGAFIWLLRRLLSPLRFLAWLSWLLNALLGEGMASKSEG
jgi:hypothetical protein